MQANLRSILSSAPACLKVIVTVRDVKPRLVEEADSLGIKVVRYVKGEILNLTPSKVTLLWNY